MPAVGSGAGNLQAAGECWRMAVVDRSAVVLGFLSEDGKRNKG